MFPTATPPTRHCGLRSCVKNWWPWTAATCRRFQRRDMSRRPKARTRPRTPNFLRRAWTKMAAPSATCWRASRKIIPKARPTASAWTRIRRSSGVQAISPGWTRIIPPARRAKGYPVEIQVLWIRLLRLLEKISAPRPTQKKWRDLADHATASFEKLFWLEEKGWFADVLLAKPRVIARDATPDDALRSNCLFAVSLGLVTGERAKRCVEAARKYLVVPGALRSLAPLPVSVPLPIYRDGQSAEQSGRTVLAALRRRRGHAPQAGLSQRHGVDVDVSDVLRGARARVGFFAGSGGGGEKLSRQRGKIVERRLPRPASRNSRRRRAAHATRLRRAGVGRDGNAARVEAAVGDRLTGFR